jgi:putative transposase
VTGFYLSMDAPSRLSVSLCLLHSVFDKSARLKERDIDEPWPVAGLPATLHVDNGVMSGRRPLSRVSLRFCEHLGRGHVYGLFMRKRSSAGLDG